MPIVNRIAEFEPDMRAWRRHLHSIPELDFDLHETAAFVEQRLREFGVDEVHIGLARTGIVALIHGQGSGPVIGLRADMDLSLRSGARGASGTGGPSLIAIGLAGRSCSTARQDARNPACLGGVRTRFPAPAARASRRCWSAPRGGTPPPGAGWRR
jgi:hypothetical protein